MQTNDPLMIPAPELNATQKRQRDDKENDKAKNSDEHNANLDARIDSQVGAGAAEPPLTPSVARSNGVAQMQAILTLRAENE